MAMKQMSEKGFDVPRLENIARMWQWHNQAEQELFCERYRT